MKPLVLVLGLAGGVAGALIVRWLEPRQEGRTHAPATRTERSEIDALVARVEALERRPLAPAPESAPLVPGSAATPGGPEGEGPGEGPAEETDRKPPLKSVEEIVRALKEKKFGPEEAGRLIGRLSIQKDQIQDVISAIQKEIVTDPTNADLHVALATAHVADLINNAVPGPQQGIIWARASKAYDAAIKLEPEHWQARFGLAFGTGQAPEFFGMRPEAIRQFEELLEIQKRKAPEPHFASTYFQLGTLYKDAGNVEKARELWSEGLRLFPDNEELKGTIEASTKR